MAKPSKLEYPKFTAVLPLSGEKVEFRPYTVKEMKSLLLQAESGEEGGLMQDVIDACVWSDKKDQFDTVDKDWLFLQIRSKSSGETIDLAHKCAKCKEKNPFTLNFETDIQIKNRENSNKVHILDTVVILTEPDMKYVNAMKEDPTQENVNHLLADCIHSIVQGESVFRKKDMSEEERVEFIEDLIKLDYDKVESWYLNRPKLFFEHEYDCKACGTKNVVKIEGATSFFW